MSSARAGRRERAAAGRPTSACKSREVNELALPTALVYIGTMLGHWVAVAKVGELSPGQGRTITARGLRLALFNEGGEYFALDDACPHQGASLASGLLHEGRVICPLHSWVFELRTGECPRQTHEPTMVYPTRCNAGAVEVEVPREVTPVES